MIIGVPKEIKNNENRAGLTPGSVKEYGFHGHTVLVEAGAGVGSGFTDESYAAAGGRIVATAEEAWSADMVVKVKEPLASEYRFFREGLILYTYLHLAPEPELTRTLLDKGVTAIAYETVQLTDGSLPLLTPMSEVAGRMSIQLGARFLENAQGGKGILLGGVPGVEPARVVVIGGGVVGSNAIRIAVGMGADVTLLDQNPDKLRKLDDLYGGRIKTVVSNSVTLQEAVSKADLLVGAVLIPGARAPKLVTKDMVRGMQAGSVIVDVSIDQGGSVETIDRITTHDEPTYTKYGVLHYAVANMPGSVARTSTIALTNVTTPYGLQIADKGYIQASIDQLAIAKGINIVHGEITCRAVAESQGLAYRELQTALSF
ncbi:alanine dehydrogenase [Gorillibacterium massiliense]|uniref:alanine dehydrogenase n=1 Tax=Gorillibacterium massiliense TaxID=1280390 RepID=UPI0004B8CF6A|nr:alanine dehydrogenase [Gorillibacterium massiliense]